MAAEAGPGPAHVTPTSAGGHVGAEWSRAAGLVAGLEPGRGAGCGAEGGQQGWLWQQSSQQKAVTGQERAGPGYGAEGGHQGPVVGPRGAARSSDGAGGQNQRRPSSVHPFTPPTPGSSSSGWAWDPHKAQRGRRAGGGGGGHDPRRSVPLRPRSSHPASPVSPVPQGQGWGDREQLSTRPGCGTSGGCVQGSGGCGEDPVAVGGGHPSLGAVVECPLAVPQLLDLLGGGGIGQQHLHAVAHLLGVEVAVGVVEAQDVCGVKAGGGVRDMGSIPRVGGCPPPSTPGQGGRAHRCRPWRR